jgi:hypothetical protein
MCPKLVGWIVPRNEAVGHLNVSQIAKCLYEIVFPLRCIGNERRLAKRKTAGKGDTSPLPRPALGWVHRWKGIVGDGCPDCGAETWLKLPRMKLRSAIQNGSSAFENGRGKLVTARRRKE